MKKFIKGISNKTKKHAKEGKNKSNSRASKLFSFERFINSKKLNDNV